MSDTTAAKGSYRWVICALLFFATTINYLDRSVLGILAPTLQKEIGWTPVEYGYITTAFTLTYAFGLAIFGWLIDRFGTKIGYTISIFGWSIAAMAHAAARSVVWAMVTVAPVTVTLNDAGT